MTVMDDGQVTGLVCLSFAVESVVVVVVLVVVVGVVAVAVGENCDNDEEVG